MSHYRTIEVEGQEYRYCVGRFVTKIDCVGLFDNHRIGREMGDEKVSVRPSHIEAAIRRNLNIPQREYDWDTPMTKKSDPGPRTRGFRDLIGVRIVDIRVSAINEVILEGENGDRYAIESEAAGPYGIPVIRLRTLAGTDAEN